MKLQEIKIFEYIELLKAGVDVERIEEVNTLLSEATGGMGSNFDMAIFQMQKDLLLLTAKHFIAVLEFDEAKQARYLVMIEKLKKQLEQKIKKVEKTDAYKSFLKWFLAVEKYLGFMIDRNNDLYYLVSATEQMMTFYDAQKKANEK